MRRQRRRKINWILNSESRILFIYTPALPASLRPEPFPLKYLLLPFVIVGRFLFWVLFAFAAWLFVRHLRRQQDKAAPPPRSAAGAVERIVACEHCGLCLPESEGIRDGEAFFCCEDHRRARH